MTPEIELDFKPVRVHVPSTLPLPRPPARGPPLAARLEGIGKQSANQMRTPDLIRASTASPTLVIHS